MEYVLSPQVGGIYDIGVSIYEAYVWWSSKGVNFMFFSIAAYLFFMNFGMFASFAILLQLLGDTYDFENPGYL